MTDKTNPSHYIYILVFEIQWSA